MNLPDTNFIPAPLWLITLLHLVTLTLHFIAMNFLFGGLLVLLFGRLEDKWHNPTVGKFVKLFPTAMAATVSLGVAPLLFLQLTYSKQAYSAAIVSAWLWLFLFVAVIVGYYLLYAAAFTARKRARRVPLLLALAAVALTYVSFTYSTVFSLAERPDLYRQLYAGNQSGTVINPDVGAWGLRWLHMLVGAVTVGGFFVGLLGKGDERAHLLGRNFFLWGMAVSVVLGLAYLVTLGDALQPLMASSASWHIVVALALSLGSIYFYFKRRFLPAGTLLFASLATMVSVRHKLRLIELTGEWDASAMRITPQWSVFSIFLVCFVVAIGTIWYLLKLFFSGRQQSTTR